VLHLSAFVVLHEPVQNSTMLWSAVSAMGVAWSEEASLQESGAAASIQAEPLVRVPVHDVERLIQQLRRALECRSVASTGMNELSSRAHTIFQLQFEIVSRKRCPHEVKRSSLTFVDLAGSERLGKSKLTGAQACAVPAAGAHLEGHTLFAVLQLPTDLLAVWAQFG
jgi:hypothetical protein